MSDGFDLLIHRHLDGTLGEDEAKAFQDRLRADPDARRRLAEMAFEHAQLMEILEPAEEVAPSSRWAKAQWVAAASILLAVTVALFAGPWGREAPPVEAPPEKAPAAKPRDVEKPPPRREGYQGFRGRVFARVVERREKTRVILKVGEILNVRDGSEAAEPGRLPGTSISIPIPRLKDGEPPGPDRDHAIYLGKLQPGQEVVLELRHVEGEDFEIVSLTEEQEEWARSGERRKPAKESPKKVGPEEREER